MKEGDIVYHWPMMSKKPLNIGILLSINMDEDAYYEDKAPIVSWHVLVEGKMFWIRERDLKEVR